METRTVRFCACVLLLLAACGEDSRSPAARFATDVEGALDAMNADLLARRIMELGEAALRELCERMGKTESVIDLRDLAERLVDQYGDEGRRLLERASASTDPCVSAVAQEMLEVIETRR